MAAEDSNILRTELFEPSREQVAAISDGVRAALDVLRLDLDGATVAVRQFRHEQEVDARPNSRLRGGTVLVDYIIKSPESEPEEGDA